ncbi:MAG: adenylyltransferase/cytidyltransferase family protein [Clostridiales bacterium]|jgi:[citrate (pro-3S)-lyase] ligase|nr:adenylyltransferase/cytidyltransferase family protein [Clostridiales bacterium]
MCEEDKKLKFQEKPRISDLQKETNFIKYTELLVPFSKQYAVFIAVCDTPCGNWFSARHSKQLLKLGLKVDLFRKYRFSFAAVIYQGNVLFESISTSTSESVEHSFPLEDLECNLKSASFDVSSDSLKNRSEAEIKINGRDYAVGGRGLNFVVFDPTNEILIDSVRFDTYEPTIQCFRNFQIPDLMKYRIEHPDISIICFVLPGFPKVNISENEKFIVENEINVLNLHKFLDSDMFTLNSCFTKDEIIEVITAPKAFYDIYGTRRFEDVSGSCLNISNGYRVTKGQPREYKRTVYLVGGCSVFGIGAADGGTIASALQKLLNDYEPEQKFIVQNYGYNLTGGADRPSEQVRVLYSLPVKPNDIVLFQAFRGIDASYHSFNFGYSFQRPHEYGDIFFDKSHYGESGYRVIAQKMFDGLKEQNFFEQTARLEISEFPAIPPEPVNTSKYKGISEEELAQLEEYKRSLRELSVSQRAANMKNGAVVMNCNPFTLGHQYLVEQAASQTDHLYVFVVQEDKSEFPFNERLKLVKEGTAHLKNVTVISSGRFIISTLTFEEYFNKSKIQSREIDTSLDITLFAKEIAPCLNICKRFAGEEPFDNITRQYNETMRRILPQYGIDFVEIPRKTTFGDMPISASYVRKLLKDHKFDDIALIVPKTTLEYLAAKSLNKSATT